MEVTTVKCVTITFWLAVELKSNSARSTGLSMPPALGTLAHALLIPLDTFASEPAGYLRSLA